MRFATYWHQLPGVAPRSTTVMPGFSNLSFSSISLSLKTARALEGQTAREFSAGVEQGKYHACGSGAITVAKLMAEQRGSQRVEVLQVTTSHEVARGSDDYVVGYLGAVVH